MCGGNLNKQAKKLDKAGLSPRVRGKPSDSYCDPALSGSIPACAGETTSAETLQQIKRVYPRVCGGNILGRVQCRIEKGLSPRVRGKHRRPWFRAAFLGSIPACAGETAASDAVSIFGLVYPRVCGGNRKALSNCLACLGLSPRVRGKREKPETSRATLRSIPACAGETQLFRRSTPRVSVYPRVCGGNYKTMGLAGRYIGLSPRVRGKHCQQSAGRHRTRSIPACAGETRSPGRRRRRARVYPRVCGGNVVKVWMANGIAGLSPRVRGKRVVDPRYPGYLRSIPACAGETPRVSSPSCGAGVYPRVCGGNGPTSPILHRYAGLSPRVRGKRSRLAMFLLGAGSIPACAGETPIPRRQSRP